MNLSNNEIKKTSVLHFEKFDDDAPPTILYTEEEVALIKQNAFEEGIKKGFEDGYTNGKDEAISAFDVSIQSILMRVEQKIERLIKDENLLLQSIEENTKTLFYAFFKKLFPTYIKKFGLDEMETFISNLFNTLLHKNALTFKIHSHFKESIKNYILNKDFEHQNIVFVDNDNLDENDCSIEWENGGAYFSLIEAYQLIEKQLTEDKTFLKGE
jgi:flagellar biosynthesis/type III secretory pathway protein FliH